MTLALFVLTDAADKSYYDRKKLGQVIEGRARTSGNPEELALIASTYYRDFLKAPVDMRIQASPPQIKMDPDRFGATGVRFVQKVLNDRSYYLHGDAGSTVAGMILKQPAVAGKFVAKALADPLLPKKERLLWEFIDRVAKHRRKGKG